MTALPPLCLKNSRKSSVAKNLSVPPRLSWLTVLTHTWVTCSTKDTAAEDILCRETFVCHCFRKIATML